MSRNLAQKSWLMMSALTSYRTSLRLTNTQYNSISRLCQLDGGKITMRAWIAQAINERIHRDIERANTYLKYTRHSERCFYEFFAGGGMARTGLGAQWDCLFANDFSPMKGHAYKSNWSGGIDLLVEDINNITSAQLPAQADLLWASFPC